MAPRKYYDEPAGDLAKVKEAAKEIDGLDIDWSTFGEWMDRVEASRPGLNIRPLVGHSTVRMAAMGSDYRRPATTAEIEAMKRYVDEAMDAGAGGISNGLDYAPNSYSTKEESYEVIGTAAKKGGIWCTHWRRTGLREGFGNPGLIDGIREAIDIAKKTEAKLQFAHLGAGYTVIPSASRRLSRCICEETLAVLDEAIKDGVDLAFDVIPNHLTGGVMHLKYLASRLMPWLKDAGSLEQLSKNLMAPDFRAEMREYITSGKWYLLNPILNPRWAGGIKVGTSSVERFVGKTLAEIAAETDVDGLEALMDVISADPYATTGSQDGSDESKRLFIKHPLAMVGVDSFVLDPTYEVVVPPYAVANPNTFGGMARFIRLYAVGLLGLEEGIRRITSLPAKTLGLADRGTLAEGMKADLVVFKPEAVLDKGNDEEPRQYPEGFNWVFVNGVAAMENGRLTGSQSGRVLRR